MTPITFIRWQQVFVATAGTLSALVGITVIIGWHTQTAGLNQIHPDFAAMQYNTAVSFLSCGLGLLGLALGRLRLALVCAVWPTVIGLLTIIQYLSGASLGIDRLLFTPSLTSDTAHPGRMCLPAAVGFLFSGCAILLLGRPARFRFRPVVVAGLSLITLGIASSAAFVYATNILTGSRWGLTPPMALHTAGGLTLLSTGLLVTAWRDYVTKTADIRQSLRAGRIPWVVLALSIAVSGWAWYAVSHSVSERARARFNDMAHQAHSTILNRMGNYEQILIGGRGLFTASRSVKRDDWRAYVHSLDLDQRFPGMQAMGFAQVVPHHEKRGYLDRLRQEGFLNVRINPPGDRTAYGVVTYTEPFTGRNRRVLGDDMFSDSVRRAAMEQARDTGLPTMTGRLRLTNEPVGDIQNGFLYFVPVYANGQPHATIAERRAALDGFTFGVFRIDDLMAGVLGRTARDIRFEIFDGAGTVNEAILFGDEFDGDLPDYRSTFEQVMAAPVGGRLWTFRFTTWPSFDAAVYDYTPVFTLIGGLMGSLLLFSITWSLTTTRARAEALADRMTNALRKSETKFRAVADHANDAIVSTDERGKIVSWNKSASIIFGYVQDDSMGKPLSMLISEQAWQANEETMTRVASGDDQSLFGKTIELTGRRKDGQEFPLELSLSAWTDGGQRFYTAIMRDITERRQIRERLNHIATHDALTGLPNRTLFADRLEQALARPAWNKRLVAVMFLDLDRFKNINDTLGHDAGDQLLRIVANRLRDTVRAGDTVARQGGDEFTIILVDMAQISDVTLVAQKILDAMTPPFDLDGHHMPVTVSIGIACYPVDGLDAPTLLKHADTALYRAKDQGRNAYQLYSAA
jgi:diguanylate cyclase (GGDEF)-like protein/PAS domain S-box-containing protein